MGRERYTEFRTLPERVVFIDETSVKTNLTRLRGRARRGTGLSIDAPFGSWATQTRIAGLTPDALIAPWCIKGRNGQPRLRSLGPRGPDPGDRAGNRGDPRQPCHPPQQA